MSCIRFRVVALLFVCAFSLALCAATAHADYYKTLYCAAADGSGHTGHRLRDPAGSGAGGRPPAPRSPPSRPGPASPATSTPAGAPASGAKAMTAANTTSSCRAQVSPTKASTPLRPPTSGYHAWPFGGYGDPPRLRSGNPQQPGGKLLALRHAPDPLRRRTGHGPLLLRPAARRGAQAGRHPLLLRGGHRPRRLPPGRPRGRRREERPLLPGGIADRPHRGGSRSRQPAHLRARQALPRRPLPRRPDLGRLDHPGGRRALRRRHRRRPRGPAPQPGHPRRRSRRAGLRSDPPHPQGHPAEPARPARLRGQARLHPAAPPSASSRSSA